MPLPPDDRAAASRTRAEDNPPARPRPGRGDWPRRGCSCGIRPSLRPIPSPGPRMRRPRPSRGLPGGVQARSIGWGV